eukprot:scaffold4715_cov115-Cylindrotheca_fusiformis.AAC.3
MEASYDLSSIVSWLPSGATFQIHQAALFEQLVLPKYFPKQAQMKSFQIQLQYYGFLNLGNHVFVHPFFRRGQRRLCSKMSVVQKNRTSKKTEHLDGQYRTVNNAEKCLMRALLLEVGPTSGAARTELAPAAAPSDPTLPMTQFYDTVPRSFSPNVIASGGTVISPLQQVLRQTHGRSTLYWNLLNQPGVPSNKDTTLASPWNSVE